MEKRLIILLMLVLAASFTNAQVIKKAQPDSIIKIITMDVEGSDDFGYTTLYTIGGKPVNKEDVFYRLLNYAPSAVEYNAYKKNATASYILFGSSFAALVGSTFEFVNNSKSPVATAAFINGYPGFTYTYPHNNKTGAYILAGVAIGTLVAAIITFSHAKKHGKKSVWLYNLRFE